MDLEGKAKGLVTKRDGVLLFVGKGNAEQLPKYFSCKLSLKNVRKRTVRKSESKIKVTK